MDIKAKIKGKIVNIRETEIKSLISYLEQKANGGNISGQKGEKIIIIINHMFGLVEEVDRLTKALRIETDLRNQFEGTMRKQRNIIDALNERIKGDSEAFCAFMKDARDPYNRVERERRNRTYEASISSLTKQVDSLNVLVKCQQDIIVDLRCKCKNGILNIFKTRLRRKV